MKLSPLRLYVVAMCGLSNLAFLLSEWFLRKAIGGRLLKDYAEALKLRLPDADGFWVKTTNRALLMPVFSHPRQRLAMMRNQIRTLYSQRNP